MVLLIRGTISVARPHKWGNPFVVGEHGVRTAASAVQLYRMWLPGQDMYRQLPELTGANLMCYCPSAMPSAMPRRCAAGR